MSDKSHPVGLEIKKGMRERGVKKKKKKERPSELQPINRYKLYSPHRAGIIAAAKKHFHYSFVVQPAVSGGLTGLFDRTAW